MTTEQAMYQAEMILLNPPEEWENAISFNGLVEVVEGNINGILVPKKGIWNELRNNMQWEITIKTSDREYTVVMDARTGKFINLWGPFS